MILFSFVTIIFFTNIYAQNGPLGSLQQQPQYQKIPELNPQYGYVHPSTLGEDLKMRCSNNSLAYKPLKCPTPNDDITIEVTNNTNNFDNSLINIGSKEQHNLIINTDKKIYSQGEMVNIMVKNEGPDSLTFPNAILGLEIQNIKTHEKYSVLSAQVITILNPKGVKSISWDQSGSETEQVPPGDYTLSVSTGSASASTTFSITK